MMGCHDRTCAVCDGYTCGKYSWPPKTQIQNEPWEQRLLHQLRTLEICTISKLFWRNGCLVESLISLVFPSLVHCSFGLFMEWNTSLRRWGIFMTCANALQGWEFVSVASPLLTMTLLLGLSGIPLQEKQAKERWAASDAYQEYRRKTNLLVPIPKFWMKLWTVTSAWIEQIYVCVYIYLLTTKLTVCGNYQLVLDYWHVVYLSSLGICLSQFASCECVGLFITFVVIIGHTRCSLVQR